LNAGEKMRIYVGFDDTDTIDCGRGTGKLARWFEDVLPESCFLSGIVRQQLLVRDDIPYTSHNSSLTCIIETHNDDIIPELIKIAAEHIATHFVEGSDPGLCVCAENNPAIEKLEVFGKKCLVEKMSQEDARFSAQGTHLSGHGGTNDGIIGAAAGVGLTHSGMTGRFNEYKINGVKLRDIPEETEAGFLRNSGIELLSMDRSGKVPDDSETVLNYGWLRPLLFLKKAVLPVKTLEKGVWEIVVKKEWGKK
jgi:tRNA(Ile2) C34 agmatinyltransferase TiaS